jgi:hypothetical protein
MKRISLSLALALLAAASCDAYNPDLGSSPFKCATNPDIPSCPDGYGEDYTDATKGCVCRLGVPAYTCNTDTHEPNDSTAAATATPSPLSDTQITNVAICPYDDFDYYKMYVSSSNVRLDVIVSYDPADGHPAPIVEIVTQADVNKATGTDDGLGTVAATFTTPTGADFYAKVYRAESGGTKNYSIVLRATQQ